MPRPSGRAGRPEPGCACRLQRRLEAGAYALGGHSYEAPGQLVGDFIKRFTAAHPRRRYLVDDWGWADLLAIIPLLRIFRVFRLVRVIRKLRGYGGARFVDDLRTNRSTSAFGLTVALVLIVVEVAGALIVSVESRSPEANIRTGIDAVWWAYVTITTVGYGDRYPVTTEGRFLGILLLVAGIALTAVALARRERHLRKRDLRGRHLRGRHLRGHRQEARPMRRPDRGPFQPVAKPYRLFAGVAVRRPPRCRPGSGPPAPRPGQVDECLASLRCAWKPTRCWEARGLLQAHWRRASPG